MSQTIRLSAPIPAHGQSVTTIELREPIGEDIAAIGGFPFTLGEGGTMTADGAKMVAYVSRLGDIPLSSARKIVGPDWLEIFGALSRFFAPATKAEAAPAMPMPPSGRPPAGKIVAKA